MQKIYTTLAFCLIILPQLFAKSYTTPVDSLVKIKPDSIIRAYRDSVLAPPIGYEQREIRTTKSPANGASLNALISISTPSLLYPINSPTVYGTSVSLYWNKNNNSGTADYYVKIVDLTTTTILYNYTPVGDLSSFEARNLVAGRTYAWLVRAVSRSNNSDVLETPFTNFVVSNTNAPTLSLTGISGTSFCGSNRQITLNYSRSGNFNGGSINHNYNGYNGNTFVELSNKDGDFINPILINSTYLNANTGSLTVVLPENLPFGQNYKIRMFAYSPIMISNTSVGMTIGTVSNPLMLNRFDVVVNGNYLDLCSGNSATIKTSLTDSSNVAFQWKKDNVNITSGGNYSKYTIRTGGNYTLAITQGTCPTVTSSSSVQIYNYSGSSSSNLWRDGNSVQCTGGSAKLTMPYWADNTTYKWYKNDLLISGETLREYSATQTGTYTVKVAESNCTMSATSDVLTFGSAISIATSVGASTICSTGGQTSASVSPTYSPNLASTYQWKRNGVNIPNANSSSITITQAGIYNAEVVQGGCTATSQGFEIKASTTLDSIKIAQDYPSFCNSSYVSLNPSFYLQNATYRWKNSGITVSTSNYHTAIEDGSYTLTVTQGSCSTTSKPVALVLNKNREIYINISGSSNQKDTIYICPSSGIPLYVNNYPSGTYQWFKDNVAISGATNSSYTPSQRGVYTFQATSGSCIVTSKPVFIETTLPKFSLNTTPATNSSCTNNIYTLDYYNKGVYPYYCGRWKKDGVVFNTCASQVSVWESGIYSVMVEQNNCVVESEPVKISIGEPISATINGSATITSGSTAKLYINFTGAAPWMFTLSDGTSITTSKNPYVLSVNPTATTTYSLTSVIGSCGTGTVSGSATVSIGSCSTPTVISVQPQSKTKCTGSSVTFTINATGGGTLTYQWKKDGQNIVGANQSTLTINNIAITDLGSYAVEVTGTCGMILSESAILKINNDVPFLISPTSIVSTVGADISFQAYTYTSISVVGFTWQGPNGFTSNLQNPILTNININNSGVYTVSGSNTQGCVGQAIASVTVLAPSIAINSLSSTNFCTGQTGTISFTPPAGLSTTYAVQLSYSDGTFSTNPTVLGTGSSSPITFTLPSGNSGTTSNYKLRVIDTQNLTRLSSPSAVIYINALTATAQSITESSYASICQGSSIKIYSKLNKADNGDVIYEWQKDNVVISGATSATYTTNQVGSYKVKATKIGCGVSTSSAMTIGLTNTSGGIYNYFTQYQCAGTSIVLKAAYNSENATFNWQKDNVTLPNQTSSLTVSESGQYTLRIIDPNCSSNYTSVSSYIFGGIIPSVLNVSDTVTICSGYGTFLSINDSNNSNGYTFQWKKDGEPLAEGKNYYYNTSTPGIYTLQITQGNCTTTSKPIVVKTGGVPSNIIKVRGGTNICSGLTPSYLYVDGLNCASYQWQKDQVDISGSTGTTFYPSQSGSYRVKINSNSTITYSNAINITVGNTATYTIQTSNDTISCFPYLYYNLNYYGNLPNATFQWLKNNATIAGANSTGYSIESEGIYKLKVTVGSCVGYSQDVNIINRNAIVKPVLVSQQGKIICGNTYTTLVPQSQNYPTYVNFQWKKNGVEIPNTMYRSWLDVTESGVYTVKYIQGSCTAESDPIKVNVGDKQQSLKTADWSNAGTWSCGTIPTIAEDVLINKTHTVSLPNGYTGFLKKLELNGNIVQGINANLKLLSN